LRQEEEKANNKMARGDERNPGHQTPDASRQVIVVVNPVVQHAKRSSGS
jgi:hypothetical protein